MMFMAKELLVLMSSSVRCDGNGSNGNERTPSDRLRCSRHVLLLNTAATHLESVRFSGQFHLQLTPDGLRGNPKTRPIEFLDAV